MNLTQSRSTAIDIPDQPNMTRMRRDTGARLRAAMIERGIGVLVLLENSAVVYATGTSWPLVLSRGRYRRVPTGPTVWHNP